MRRQTLVDLLNRALDRRLVVVISVRSEWLAEMVFLGSLLPRFSEVVVLDSAQVTGSDSTYNTVLGLIDELVDRDNGAPQAIASEVLLSGHEFRPLEVQIVGTELEMIARVARLTTDTLANELGGVGGAVNRHFRTIVDSTGSPYLAARVLYVMSVRKSHALTLDRREVAQIIHEPTARVSAVADVLVAAGLINTTGGGAGLELRHDFVGTYFENASQEKGDPRNRLDPIERDSLRVRASGLPTIRLRPVIRDPDDVDRSPRLGAIVFSVLAGFTTARLLGLDMWWTTTGDIPPVYLYNQTFDLTYAPTFVAHLVWAYYVAMSFDNSYRHLNERGLQRFGSYFVLFNMVGCVVVAYFLVQVWVASVAWGGLVLGFKMFSIGFLPVSDVGRKEFRKGGILTIANSSIAMLGGVAFALASSSLITRGTWNWMKFSVGFAAVLIFAGVELTRRHVTPKSARRYLCLLGR